tara:strand:+ start:997 stop:1827 length:831 start_codon:yes stop_codon:yes gene_type:complete
MSVRGSEGSTLSEELESMLSLLAKGNTSDARELSDSILERSRSVSERNHDIEARVRIERALIGAVPEEMIGSELRWCVDRLNAISSGSSVHGLALLNLATWHANRGELMMALATHSEISINNGHPLDINSLSRLEVGRILTSMNDYGPAMRHLWSARSGFIELGMSPEAIATSLEWLDLALDDISDDSPKMTSRIEEARPRHGPGNTTFPSNPSDITAIVEYLFPILTQDLSGTSRLDIGLIIEASEKINRHVWKDAIASRKNEIQDPNLLEVFQS